MLKREDHVADTEPSVGRVYASAYASMIVPALTRFNPAYDAVRGARRQNRTRRQRRRVRAMRTSAVQSCTAVSPLSLLPAFPGHLSSFPGHPSSLAGVPPDLRRAFLATMLVLLAVLVHAPASMRAQTLDSLRASLPIAGVYHLNFDCWPDTVLAERTARGGFLPRAILWGHPQPGGSGQGGSGGGYDTACLGPIPPTLRKPFTLFTYPAWAQPGGSFAFERFNGDSLTDLMFYLRGRVQSGSAGRWHDTVRRMVVFGQHALDTLSTINLAEVPAFQFAPFFAMNLIEGVHLNERATRDLSGAPSYILHPVSLQVNTPNVGAPNAPATHESTPRADGRTPMVGMPMAGIVRVYPNPAATAAGVEAARLDAGEYTVEVVGTNGRVELRRRVSVAASGTLLQTLDVSGLASGYYVVRVTRDGAVTGTYPIVVAH